MSEDLSPIGSALSNLEADVIVEYRRLVAESGDPKQRIHLPVDRLATFNAALEALRQSLYGGHDRKTLRLVSDEHDRLRIRMICLQHLLGRDLPRVYVDEALKEFHTALTRPSAPAPTSEVTISAAQGPGFLTRCMDYLRGLFRSSAHAAPGLADGADEAEGVAQSRGGFAAKAVTLVNDLRLAYLHKLMESDTRKLLAEAERLPAIPSDTRLPATAAQFHSKDIGETHHAVRSDRPRGADIARTPEELRAKLAQRRSDTTDK